MISKSRDPYVLEAVRYSTERVRESERLLATDVPVIDHGLSSLPVAICAVAELQEEKRRRWEALARAPRWEAL